MEEQIETALFYNATTSTTNATDEHLRDWLMDAKLYLYLSSGTPPVVSFYNYFIQRLSALKTSKYIDKCGQNHGRAGQFFRVYAPSAKDILDIDYPADVFTHDLTDKMLMLCGRKFVVPGAKAPMQLQFSGNHALVKDFWKDFISRPQLIDEARVARVRGLLKTTEDETKIINELGTVI